MPAISQNLTGQPPGRSSDGSHCWNCPPSCSRALTGFPIAVRTLDALHLASIEFLRRQGQTVELATYDRRMADAAHAMGIPIIDPAA